MPTFDFGQRQPFLTKAPGRNDNSRVARQIGADVGCDSFSDWPQAETLSRFLDTENALPKTVLNNVNPAWNYADGTRRGAVPHIKMLLATDGGLRS